MRRLLIIFFVLYAAACCWSQDTWLDSLYLGNGEQWRQRIPVKVSNHSARDFLGDVVSLPVGEYLGDLQIGGEEAKSIRVCDSLGNEMLFDLRTPQGNRLTSGKIPIGAILTIPVECKAKSEVLYWVYYDNTKAWEVPDHLDIIAGVRNASMEEGEGEAPVGWIHDAMDSQHQALWSSQNPRSGNRCLETTVEEGSNPSWISTRQGSIRITGGAKYTFCGWVRAKNAAGRVGWYIHLGNEEVPIINSHIIESGEGSYDWKEVKIEFVAPENVTLAQIGTVLFGTGTAWFDDVSLETDAATAISAIAGISQKLTLRELNTNHRWIEGDHIWRYPIRITNTTDARLDPGKVCVDLSGALARLRGRSSLNAAKLYDGVRAVKHTVFGDTLLFNSTAIPPKSSKIYYLYFPLEERLDLIDTVAQTAKRSTGTSEDDRHLTVSAPNRNQITLVEYLALLNDPKNLIQNPSFENKDLLESTWKGGAEGKLPEGAQIGYANLGLFGSRSTKLYVPENSGIDWLGFRQEVPVKANKSYLYAGWVKCDNNKGDTVTLHAHIKNSEKEVLFYASTGAGISGTTDWSVLAGIFTIPQGGRIFQSHLTIHSSGIINHDGIVLIEVIRGQVGELETVEPYEQQAITAWQINAIEKVFKDDVPIGAISAATISAAGNEYEPLQIALRSNKDLADVKVSVEFPTNTAGLALDRCEVGVVGYVPIDFPSNYYSLTTPSYYRKYPATGGSSDGWAGLWPDPLMPINQFDLEANTTQPIWITVYVPADTPAGEYNGNIALSQGDTMLKTIPFTVNVWSFNLPETNSSVAVYDSRADSRWQIPGQSEEETKYQLWEFMAKYRLCPDMVKPQPVFKFENGELVVDFEDFDRAAEVYFDKLHLNHTYTPWDFYMFGWGFPPSDKYGENPYDGEYPFDDVDRSTLRPEFKNKMQAAIRAYWEHVKNCGWDKYVAFYISDEPFYSETKIIKQMQALCEMIAEVDPEIPIYSSTWGQVPEWDGYINFWGIGHYGIVNEQTMHKLKESGVKIRFTTDGQMCTDTPYCAIERLLPHYAFKYGADGYEFWGGDWLTYDPYKFGWHQYIHQSDTPGKSYYVRYPNGDGFIMYPGAQIGHKGPVPSIRMEQAREGVEDYEYLHLLTTLVEQAKSEGKDITLAQEVLDLADSLVGMPSAGGRFSTKILPNPDALYKIRTAVAEAIVEMQK